MLAKPGRTAADINGNVKDTAAHNPYKFALGMLSFLEMQATEHSVRAFALIILDKVYGPHGFREVLPAPGFKEIPTGITEHFGFNDDYTWN